MWGGPWVFVPTARPPAIELTLRRMGGVARCCGNLAEVEVGRKASMPADRGLGPNLPSGGHCGMLW